MDNRREFDSQKLKRKLLKENNMSSYQLDKNYYQAHHIIPCEIITSYISSNLNYEDEDFKNFDEAWNGMLIPRYGGDLCHNGSHPKYNDFIKTVIGVSKYVYVEDLIAASFFLAEVIVRIYNDSEILHGQEISMDEFCRKYLEPNKEQIKGFVSTNLQLFKDNYEEE